MDRSNQLKAEIQALSTSRKKAEELRLHEGAIETLFGRRRPCVQQNCFPSGPTHERRPMFKIFRSFDRENVIVFCVHRPGSLRPHSAADSG